jgi:hypothetical protein
MTPSTEQTKDPLTDQMSDPIPKPRTDAVAYDSQPGNPMVPNGCAVVPANFARELERELIELRDRLSELEKDRERLDWLDGNLSWGWTRSTVLRDREKGAPEEAIRAAIDAAMKGEAR